MIESWRLADPTFGDDSTPVMGQNSETRNVPCDPLRVATAASEGKTRIAFAAKKLGGRRVEERSNEPQQRLLLRPVSAREEVGKLDMGDVPA
jgi:hypothetical protein